MHDTNTKISLYFMGAIALFALVSLVTLAGIGKSTEGLTALLGSIITGALGGFGGIAKGSSAQPSNLSAEGDIVTTGPVITGPAK